MSRNRKRRRVKRYPSHDQDMKKKAAEACSVTVSESGVTYHTAQKPKNSGFSLIELVIVVAIIGIISAAAVPSWLKRVENQRAKLTVDNTELLNLAVHDVMVREGVQEMTFGQMASNDKWLDVQWLIKGGFDAMNVVGYTFDPSALNDCYLSVLIFRCTDRPLYVKHID